MQRFAKPWTSVQFRSGPPNFHLIRHSVVIALPLHIDKHHRLLISSSGIETRPSDFEFIERRAGISVMDNPSYSS